MKKWNEIVVRKAEKQEKIQLGQDLDLSDTEEKMSRSSNEYSLFDNSFDTQLEKEKTTKAAEQASTGWLDDFDKNLHDIDLDLSKFNFDDDLAFLDLNLNLGDLNPTVETQDANNNQAATEVTEQPAAQIEQQVPQIEETQQATVEEAEQTTAFTEEPTTQAQEAQPQADEW